MINDSNLKTVMPKAVPTEDELRLWQCLPADERQRRLSLALDQARAGGTSDKTLEDLWADSLSRLRKNREHAL